MAPPVIALLTDFGVRDHYVASMKGVILGIVPDVTLVDVTHEIEPQDVMSAALELRACWRDFPAGTIFLTVVDPGVGTARRALAAAAGDCFFIAPDNGVLGPVLEQQPPSMVVELSERKYLRPVISRTFEGRDRFAPAAAWLARGTSIELLGPRVVDWVRPQVPQPRAAEGMVTGEILTVDRFGNLISNIDAVLLDGLRGPGRLVVRVGEGRAVPLVETYESAPGGGLCALVGSSGRLEVAVNGGSAARLLALGRGARVIVVREIAGI